MVGLVDVHWNPTDLDFDPWPCVPNAGGFSGLFGRSLGARALRFSPWQAWQVSLQRFKAEPWRRFQTGPQGGS